MEFKKILETVFIKDWNTEAHILENGIEVRLDNGRFMTRKECFEEINTYKPGWVQSSLSHRFLNKKREENGGHDYLIQYDTLFNELEKYAKNKFKEFTYSDTVNSFNFKWYTTEEEEGKKYTITKH